MGIQSLTNQIASVDREIANLERQISPLEKRLSSKQKDANRILEKINREKDFKKIIRYQKDLTRKNDEITRLDKDRSRKTEMLGKKQKKKLELHQKLTKEEQKERANAKKEQKEILSIQRQITDEIERQQNLSIESVKETHILLNDQKQYDVFISHASEDKKEFVRPLAKALKKLKLRVWYDEFELNWGDSLRRSIDRGLSNSRYGIVVLSEAFFRKEWPQKELDGLVARESGGDKVILPIWHKITKNEVIKFSPTLGDKKALNTSTFMIEEIAEQVAALF